MSYRIQNIAENNLYLNADMHTFSPKGYSWKKIESARNVMERAMVKYPRLKIVEEVPAEAKADMNENNVKKTTTADLSDMSLRQMLDKLQKNANECAEILSRIVAVQDGYNEELSKQDLLTQDFLHMIEFGNLSASQTAHLAKQLKECRVRRRQIKDTMIMLQKLSAKGISENVFASISDIIKDLDKGEYSPKVYTNA